MNVIDEKQVAAVIVNPALDRVQKELIPALEAAIQRRVNDALLQASTLAMTALTGLDALEGKTASDLRSILGLLDGWTATVSIPVITIALNGPPAVKAAKAITGGAK